MSPCSPDNAKGEREEEEDDDDVDDDDGGFGRGSADSRAALERHNSTTHESGLRAEITRSVSSADLEDK